MNKNMQAAQQAVQERFDWYREYAVAVVVALESLGSLQRLEELGLVDWLGGTAPYRVEGLAPPSRGGRSLPSSEERYAKLLLIITETPQARASIAKIRRFDAAGDMEAIYVELAFWLGVGEGFVLPGAVERDA